MKIKCPSCRQEYDVDGGTLGQKVKCECGCHFVARSDEKPKKLTPCKDCGEMISINATVCPHCGAPMTVPKLSIMNIIAFFICLCICFAAFIVRGEDAENILQQIYHALSAICILLVGVMVAALFREG